MQRRKSLLGRALPCCRGLRVRGAAVDTRDVGGPRDALRPARRLHRPRLLVHVLPQERQGLGQRGGGRREQAAALRAGRGRRGPGVGRVRRRERRGLDQPRPPRGLRQAEKVPDHEARRRRGRVVDRVHVRRQAVPRPWRAAPAPLGRDRLRAATGGRPARGVPGRQARAQSRRLHVLRVPQPLRTGRVHGDRATVADPVVMRHEL